MTDDYPHSKVYFFIDVEYIFYVSGYKYVKIQFTKNTNEIRSVCKVDFCASYDKVYVIVLDSMDSSSSDDEIWLPDVVVAKSRRSLVKMPRRERLLSALDSGARAK